MEKLRIWGEQIPYNTGKSKLEDMTIRRRPLPVAGFGWFRDIFGEYVTKDMGRLDTFSYLDEIRSGKTSRFYDDVPTLVPFLVKGSKTAVIVAPGGGFCNLSRKREGYDMARFLNENGISAFVLEYRLNPYKAPVCYLDMQRAIRYVRHHAVEYGISSKQIGAMGFSAGGYVTGASYILLGNAPVEYKGYKPDEVDEEDGRADFLSMIYPVVCFDENPNMLALLAGKDFFDAEKRKQLREKYSLTEQLKPSEVPQFLCYGTRDMLKGIDRYGAKLEELKVPHKTVCIDGAGHGFALNNKKYFFWAKEYVRWIQDVVK